MWNGGKYKIRKLNQYQTYPINIFLESIRLIFRPNPLYSHHKNIQ